MLYQILKFLYSHHNSGNYIMREKWKMRFIVAILEEIVIMIIFLSFPLHCCLWHLGSFLLCRVTPPDGDPSPSGAPGCSDGPVGATCGAGAMALPAISTLSLPMSQGKPSLRRIKGRIHRSKSLDSLDLLDANVRLADSQQLNIHRYTTSATILAYLLFYGILFLELINNFASKLWMIRDNLTKITSVKNSSFSGDLNVQEAQTTPFFFF